MMKPLYHPPVAAELEHVQPLGDFVLVKRLPDAEREGSIIIPASARNPERGLRRGIVIACGPGDWLTEANCLNCSLAKQSITGKFGTCECGSKSWQRSGRERVSMHVKPGDQVVYSRSPANDISLNGDDYTFLHEEQHVVAVLETS